MADTPPAFKAKLLYKPALASDTGLLSTGPQVLVMNADQEIYDPGSQTDIVVCEAVVVIVYVIEGL